MRSIAVLAAVCGLALLTGLTVYYGLGAVAAAVVSSGWATVLVVAVRAAALACRRDRCGGLEARCQTQRRGFVRLRNGHGCLQPVSSPGASGVAVSRL